VFNFITGRVKRAPLWMQRSGLEWLYRLLREPRRLWKRYIVNDIPVLARMSAEALRTRSGLPVPIQPVSATAEAASFEPTATGVLPDPTGAASPDLLPEADIAA
jgi:Glycosyl transferase WecG/TagA/CpsF family